MGAKMDETKSEIVRIRVSAELRDRGSKARSSGSWSGRTESDFYGYLIELGLVRYERSILPIERGDDLGPFIKQGAQSSQTMLTGLQPNDDESAKGLEKDA